MTKEQCSICAVPYVNGKQNCNCNAGPLQPLSSNLVADLRVALNGHMPVLPLHDGKAVKAKCVICGNFNRFWYVIEACNFCQSCVSEAIASPVVQIRSADETQPSASKDVVSEVYAVYRRTLDRDAHGTGHYDGCWKDHWACLVEKLLDHIGRITPVETEPKPCRGCGRYHEPPECSIAWLVEDGASPPRYRTADGNGFGWTLDVNKAIRLSRRCDAEMVAAADDAAWKIVEHMWSGSSVEPAPVESEGRRRATPSPESRLRPQPASDRVVTSDTSPEKASEPECSWGCHYVGKQFVRNAACTLHGASSENGSAVTTENM